MSENPKKFVPPNVAFEHQVNIFGTPDLRASVMGDITAGDADMALGVMKSAGKIRAVNFMMATGDGETNQELSCEVDVQINGVSCLDTKPKVSYKSGEYTGQMNTMASGEGIIEAILDLDNRTYTRGDNITFDYTIVSGTPTIELSGLGVLVELEPILPT